MYCEAYHCSFESEVVTVPAGPPLFCRPPWPPVAEGGDGYVLLSASPFYLIRQTRPCFLLLTLRSWLFVGPADLKMLNLLLMIALCGCYFSFGIPSVSFLGRL